MFSKTKTAVIGAAALAVIAGGIGVAQAYGTGPQSALKLCYKDDPKTTFNVQLKPACYSNFRTVELPAVGVPGPQGPQGPAGPAGNSNQKMTPGSVTLDANFINAGSDSGTPTVKATTLGVGYVCKALVVSGAPAWSTSVREMEFDNSADINDAEQPVADVKVFDAAGNKLRFPLGKSVATQGSTDRHLMVCAKGFTGKRSEVLTVALLSFVG